MNHPDTDIFRAIVSDVAAERIRQEDLRAAGKFEKTAASEGSTDNVALRIYGEELTEALDEYDLVTRLQSSFGRLCRLGNDEAKDGENVPTAARSRLRKELVESAATLFAWIEKIDREAKPKH